MTSRFTYVSPALPTGSPPTVMGWMVRNLLVSRSPPLTVDLRVRDDRHDFCQQSSDTHHAERDVAQVGLASEGFMASVVADF